jgi:NAD(P)-dependent dehydrogenase (short-subunit alcohol dehydrogenase family)
MTQTVLITGSAGIIGSQLRGSLAQVGRHLRLLDIAAQHELAPGEDAELISASFTDDDAILEACRGADVVVHLGGLSTGGYSWDEYLDVNINGTFRLFEAARRAGVPRVIYASSHHAVGFHPNTPGVTVPDYLFARPDSFYGVSKAASESLASLYHDRYGIGVICLRIGSYRDRPTDERVLWNWLSPDDCTRLFEAAIVTPSPGFRLVWGVSANTRGIMSLAEAAAIGYHPMDNAEDFAHQIIAGTALGDPELHQRIGGPYTSPTFDDREA